MNTRFAAWLGTTILTGAAIAAGGSGDARLAGNWRLDAAGSDDFQVQLSRFLESEEQDRQRRMIAAPRMRRRPTLGSTTKCRRSRPIPSARG
jgi:hypothetical protein